MRIKIQKIADKFGTEIVMGDGNNSKFTQIAPELDFKTIELLEAAINKLFEEFETPKEK